MWKILLTVLWLPCIYAEEVPSRLVNTAQGPIRGYKEPNYDIYAFYGIPYATAPTGVNKFKAPQPPPTWKKPFESINKNIICPQADYFGFIRDDIVIQEDCLIANIYVPAKFDGLLPVALYVHGGAYIMGSGIMVDPRFLVQTQKVIIITFNYRLAAHGFLCLGTEDIPGNAGMKDQVAILRWVAKNIASFGGNPNDVTLVGSSAGSSSVDLLMISKLTKGLFNKAIPESGANVATFSVQPDPIKSAKEWAKLISSEINTDNIYALEDFFKTISLEQLNSPNPINRTDATFLMSPCVERDIGQEMFFDDSPINILKNGKYEKVPMLYGFAKMEGLLRLMFNGGNIQNDLEHINNNFVDFLPADLYFVSNEERAKVANDIKIYYFGKSADTEDVLDYVNYFSDTLFIYSTLKSVKLQVEAGNNQIYLYEYSFTDESTPYVPFTKVKGATHCAQSNALWWSEIDTNSTEDYKEMRNTLRDIWLNFMITGNPAPEGSKIPEWPAVGRKWSPHMSIGKVLELRGSLLKERTYFWEGIYSKYHRAPQPPPEPLKHTEL